jgi:hypothetical protein
MNKHAEYYENLDFFGCFGEQGSLKVAIGDHGSLEIAHILFFCFFLLFDCITLWGLWCLDSSFGFSWVVLWALSWVFLLGLGV